STFTHHKTIAISIERSRSFRRLVVALRKGAHRAKTTDTQFANSGFRPTCEHDVDVTALDETERLAQGMSARRTGGRNTMVRALEAVLHRNVARREIADDAWNEKGADPARPFFQSFLVLGLNNEQSAQPNADTRAHAFADFFFQNDARGLHGFRGRDHR